MAQQEQRIRQRITRFVTSAKGAVLTIGALAGAVGAVIALLPKHEPAPSTLKASFSRVTAYPNVDLEEYEERYASRAVGKIDGPGAHSPPVLTVPYRLVDATDARAAARPTASSDPASVSESPSAPEGVTETTSPDTSTEATETPESTTSTQTTETTEDSTTTEETSAPAEAPPASAPFKEIDGVLARDGNGTDPAEEQAVVGALSEVELPAENVAGGLPPGSESADVAVPDACNSPPCAMTPMIANALTYDPDTVKAARAVAAAFGDSRGRVTDNKLYPIGVAVNYTIELAGFKDREAILEWSLWSKSEGKPLPKRWLRNVIAEEIKPKAEDESFSSQFWIPTPHSRGDYVVHLTVYDSDHVEHGEAETEPPFH
jgi:hypothetical protein